MRSPIFIRHVNCSNCGKRCLMLFLGIYDKYQWRCGKCGFFENMLVIHE